MGRMVIWALLLLSVPLLILGVPPTNRRAFWLEPTLIGLPDPALWGVFFELHYNLNGPVDVPSRSGAGLPVVYEYTLSSSSFAAFPNLDKYLALRLKNADINLIHAILKGDAAVASYYSDGSLKESTRIQIQGVLDTLYSSTAPLGVSFNSSAITLTLWAPTAISVNAVIYNTHDALPGITYPMTYNEKDGTWLVSNLISNWNLKYYLYQVEVYVPEVSGVVVNTVTDPYSVSLAVESSRSQIINILEDDAFKPKDWDIFTKPSLESVNDIVVYELHIRDFSVFDASVPAEERGTYNAFQYNGAGGKNVTNGMRHLMNLAAAGLTHVHLLPSYDLGSVPELHENRKDPDPSYLATFPSDSQEQQRIIGETRYIDSYNWGYDPVHYGVPDGGYAVPSEQSGGPRILRYRTLVKNLADVGLRVIQDVVYNHVFAYGQSSSSILDKIVPGYYIRLDNNGAITQQSCCPDLATELKMAERLMIDHLILWAKVYKMDAFRFDLMGFHTKANMQNIRGALDALTIENDGVEGKLIYIYGEGWDFGSAKAKGLSIASQFGVAGLGIGTFNDRIRDGIHGGSREDSLEIRTQGFINGLSYDWNGYYYNGRYQGDLRYRTDVIRLGLAGNLQNYQIVDQNGNTRSGKDFDGVAYALSPRECINYAASHDDQSLFDLCVFKAPSSTTRDDRSRIQNLAISIIALSQGIPFFDAGVDMLRSKSLDRNTYDSGDWFNGLDYTYNKNNFGIGMPPSWNNQARYDIIAPHLRDSNIAPTKTEILKSVEHLKEMIKIRKSSKLFRLSTEGDVKSRVRFYNTGTSQVDAIIVMELFDDGNGLPQIDPIYRRILCVFNADKFEKRIIVSALSGLNFSLHPLQKTSADASVKNSNFNSANGEIYVPKKTTAVFVLSR